MNSRLKQLSAVTHPESILIASPHSAHPSDPYTNNGLVGWQAIAMNQLNASAISGSILKGWTGLGLLDQAFYYYPDYLSWQPTNRSFMLTDHKIYCQNYGGCVATITVFCTKKLLIFLEQKEHVVKGVPKVSGFREGSLSMGRGV